MASTQSSVLVRQDIPLELPEAKGEAPAPLSEEAKPQPLESSLENFLAIFRKLTDYTPIHEELFKTLHSHLRQAGLLPKNLQDDDALLFKRLLPLFFPHKNEASADETYNILRFAYEHLAEVMTQHKNNMTTQEEQRKVLLARQAQLELKQEKLSPPDRATLIEAQAATNRIITAINLLNVCPNTLEPLLNITNEGEEKSDVSVSIFNLCAQVAPPIPSTGFRPAELKSLQFDAARLCDAKTAKGKSNTIEQKEKTTDSAMARLQKRLQNQGIYVDSMGFVYHYSGTIEPQKKNEGNDSVVNPGRAANIPLDQAIDYAFIHRYLFIFETLRQGHKGFFSRMMSYGLPVADYLIPTAAKKQYAPVLRHLSPKYIQQNHARLAEVFKRNELAAGIMEEKIAPGQTETLGHALLKAAPDQLITLLSPDQLFLLFVFHFKKKSDVIKTIWPLPSIEKEISSLQQLIATFIATDFGRRADNPYPAPLKRLFQNSKTADLASQLWEIMSHLPGHFEPDFLCQFALSHLTPKEQQAFLITSHKQHNEPNTQLQWLESLKNPELIKQVIILWKSYKVAIYPASLALYAPSTPADDFQPSLLPPPPIAPWALDDLEQDPSASPQVMDVKINASHRLPVAIATPIGFVAEEKGVAPPPPPLNSKLLAQVKKRQTVSIAGRALTNLNVYKEQFLNDQIITESKTKPNPKYIIDEQLRGHRAYALTSLMSLFTSSDPYWKNFEDLVKSPEFKESAGFYDTSKTFASMRAPTASVWHIVSTLITEMTKQKLFFRQFQQPEKLTQLFARNEFWSHALKNEDDLALIFRYGNRELFVNCMLKYDRLDLCQQLITNILNEEEKAQFYQQFKNVETLTLFISNDKLFAGLPQTALYPIFAAADKKLFTELMIKHDRISSCANFMAAVRTQTATQKEFYKEFKNEDLLQKILSDDKSFAVLNAKDLEFIFQHGNTQLFVSLMVQCNRIPAAKELLHAISASPLQTAFYRHFQNPLLLTHAIRDDKTFSTFTPDDLAQIFKFGDKALFLQLVQESGRLDQWVPIQVESLNGPFVLTADIIRQILGKTDLDASNALRTQLNIPRYIPKGYHRAGLDGLLDGASELTADLAYQLIDSDLHNIDTWLLQTYAPHGIFANTLAYDEELKEVKFGEAKKSTVSDEKRIPSKVSFFHIPANIQPILEETDLVAAAAIENKRIEAEKAKTAKLPGSPSTSAAKEEKINYNGVMVYRFLMKVKSLVDSYDPSKHDKPIVFTVWLNTGKNHYIPCLIYKNRKGHVQVTTINPSPETSFAESKTPDGKTRIEMMIYNMLKQVFPDCGYNDLRQTKQIRQRDCGYRTATDFEDIFEAATRDTPIVTIVNDLLQVDPKRLSISFNEQPYRIRDFDRKQFLYSPDAAQIAALDRKKWATRLLTPTTTHYFVLDDQPTIAKPLVLRGGIEPYSYQNNIDKQDRGDRLGELKSRIVMLLLGVVNVPPIPGVDDLPPPPQMLTALKKYGLSSSRLSANAEQIEEFKRTLTLPKFEKMDLYVKAVREGYDELQRAQNALRTAAHLAPESFVNPIDEIIAIGQELGEDAGDLASPEKYLQAILIDNLKTYYPEVIQGGFRNFLRSYRLNDIKETPIDMVQAYLRQDLTAQMRFNELRSSNMKDASTLNKALEKMAEAVHKEKFTLYCRDIVLKNSKFNLIKILKQIPTPAAALNNQLAVQLIIQEFKQSPYFETTQAFAYFEKHAARELEQIILNAYTEIKNIYRDNTLRYMQSHMAALPLDKMPKPTTLPCTLLAPEFLALLPAAEQKGVVQTVLRRDDLPIPGKEIPSHDPRRSLFSYALVQEIDGAKENEPLTTAYKQAIDQQLRQYINNKLDHPAVVAWLESQTPSTLSEIKSNDILIQDIAKRTPLELYTVMNGFETQKHFYQAGIDHITVAFRERVQRALQTKLRKDYELILTSYHLLGKETLELLFKVTSPSILLPQVTQALTRLPTGRIVRDEKTQLTQREPNPSLTEEEKRTLANLMGSENAKILADFSHIYGNAFFDYMGNVNKYVIDFQRDIANHEAFFRKMKHYLIKENPSDAMFATFMSISEKLQRLNESVLDFRFQSYARIRDEQRLLETTLKETFDLMIHALLTELNVIPGNIAPHNTQNAARLLLCSMLGLKQPKRYLSGTDALIIDQYLQKRCQDLQPLSLPLQLNEISPPYDVNKPTPIPPAIPGKLTPRILAQIATNWLSKYDEAMLPGQAIPSHALQSLFHALNQLPSACRADEELSQEWCNTHIQPWLFHLGIQHEMQPNNKAEPFLFALQNCRNFTSYALQDEKAPNDVVKVSELNALVDVYQRQLASAASIDRYLRELPADLTIEDDAKEEKASRPEGSPRTPPSAPALEESRASETHSSSDLALSISGSLPIAVATPISSSLPVAIAHPIVATHSAPRATPSARPPLTERKVATVSATLFQRGTFKSLRNNTTEGIQSFMACITYIKRRHGLPPESKTDFALNEGDIDILKKLLVKHWEEMAIASQLIKIPQNYLHFLKESSKATDRIYGVIAITVQKGLENLGKEVRLSQLLMPKLPEVKPESSQAQLFLYKPFEIPVPFGCESISVIPNDVFSLKNAVIFPNGDWLPKDYFIEIYKRTGKLQNIFQEKLLTEKEVQFILETYPDVAESLMPEFMAKYQNPFTDTIVDNLLIFIHRMDQEQFHQRDIFRPGGPQDALNNFVNQLRPEQSNVLFCTPTPGTDGGVLGQLFNMKPDDKSSTCARPYITKLALALWVNRPDIPASRFEPLLSDTRKPNGSRAFDLTPRLSAAKSFELSEGLALAQPGEKALLKAYLQHKKTAASSLRR